MAALQTGLEHYIKAGDADPSVESQSSDEDEGEGDGSENGSEVEELEFEPSPTSTFPVKPASITEGDWKVYRAVVLTQRSFYEKWKPTWA